MSMRVRMTRSDQHSGICSENTKLEIRNTPQPEGIFSVQTIRTGESTTKEGSVTPGTLMFPGVLHVGASAFLTFLFGTFSLPRGASPRRFVVPA